jgi:hypothetical protein
MKNFFLFIALGLMISSKVFCLPLNQTGKRVIIVGEGVTGTWAAAKISENLTQNDELIIVSPPKKDLVKNIGHGVFRNYMTSAFFPIGIQIESGVMNLEPPSQDDIKQAQSSLEYNPDLKLYVSHYLDNETKNKLEQYIHRDQNKDFNSIILRYHREICLSEWKKYIKEDGKEADLTGLYFLSENVESLEKMKEKMIKNRIHSGYPADEEKLKILGPEKMADILPRYSKIIKTKKLSGLIGLDFDGRVKGQAVMQTLNKKINTGKPKLIKMHAWVESLQTNKDDKGNIIVTGIKLQNRKILKSDIVVLALGQGIEKVLHNSNLNLNVPILNKWGIVYSLPHDSQIKLKEEPTIIAKGLGIVRDMPNIPITFALGELILPKGEEPDPKKVVDFVNKSIMIWSEETNTKNRGKNYLPIYVQPRPMTLDGLPVLDSRTKGLIILNPSGSQGNTQAPGSAYFAASKVLEQLGRKVPPTLRLPDTVDWKQFELYPGRFEEKYN